MWFAQSAAWVEIDPATVPDDVEYLGFAFTQFALPVVAGAGLDFDFRPAREPACAGGDAAAAIRSDRRRVCCWRP